MSKLIWTIDPVHSEIGFKVKHMMFTNVTGKFNTYPATIENENDHLVGDETKLFADIQLIKQ